MVLTLTQKLLLSNVILTSFFLTFIFVVYYDLMRSLSNAVLQLLPGILIFCFGMVASSIFSTPALIFKYLLPIKSGYARGVLAASIFPLVSAATRALSIIGGCSSFIDKMWFYWRQRRLFFPIRMLGVFSMLLIAGNTLFKIILTDQATIAKGAKNLYKIGTWLGTILGIVLFLITLLSLPRLFRRQEEDK